MEKRAPPEITVAIVEDWPEFRTNMHSFINESDGFECDFVFGTAEEAIEMLPAIEPNIVLMDISLPGISGIECIRRIKAAIPKTQFLMLTVFDDDENIFDALKAGASGYMLKKNSPEKILEAVEELHNGGSPMSSEIARKVVMSFKNIETLNNELAALSPRENEVLTSLAKGYMYKEIADKCDISIETVKKHCHKIYEKLQVQSKTEAINKFYGKK
ncbi:MAG: response regulator transcription factor [Chitinophagales bacterium]|nr:response regulator transcription factor [Chitinophagales bacterium]